MIACLVQGALAADPQERVASNGSRFWTANVRVPAGADALFVGMTTFSETAGERLMRPAFGAGIRDFIHLPNNETTRALLADAALRALVRDEPRILVEEVQALPELRAPSRVNLSVRYRLRATGRSERFDLALDLGTTLAAPR